MTNRVLLTGAGFTRNFGGSLAVKVSTEIFNHIRNSQNLKKILRSNFDFEDVYQRVIQSQDYSMEEKTELNAAIQAVFNDIDAETRRVNFSNINIIKFSQFIFLFGNTAESGFVFTLNQDTFVESHRNHFLQTQIELPIPGQTRSIFNPANPFDNRIQHQISYNNFETFKAEQESKFGLSNNHIYYIKLHGSHNWNIENNPNNLMVIGHGKHDRIKSETLLAWYFGIFKSRLRISNTKLLIIGYGFNDKHINKIIYESKKTLKLYIINPEPAKDFFGSLSGKPFGDHIKNLVEKYYDVDLPTLMGNHSSDPHKYWKDLQKDYFDLNELQIM